MRPLTSWDKCRPPSENARGGDAGRQDGRLGAAPPRYGIRAEATPGLAAHSARQLPTDIALEHADDSPGFQ